MHVKRSDGQYEIWHGEQARLLDEWMNWKAVPTYEIDYQQRPPKPDPTIVFNERDANDLVVAILTGPPGPVFSFFMRLLLCRQIARRVHRTSL